MLDDLLQANPSSVMNPDITRVKKVMKNRNVFKSVFRNMNKQPASKLPTKDLQSPFESNESIDNLHVKSKAVPKATKTPKNQDLTKKAISPSTFSGHEPR